MRGRHSLPRARRRRRAPSPAPDPKLQHPPRGHARHRCRSGQRRPRRARAGGGGGRRVSERHAARRRRGSGRDAGCQAAVETRVMCRLKGVAGAPTAAPPSPHPRPPPHTHTCRPRRGRRRPPGLPRCGASRRRRPTSGRVEREGVGARALTSRAAPPARRGLWGPRRRCPRHSGAPARRRARARQGRRPRKKGATVRGRRRRRRRAAGQRRVQQTTFHRPGGRDPGPARRPSPRRLCVPLGSPAPPPGRAWPLAPAHAGRAGGGGAARGARGGVGDAEGGARRAGGGQRAHPVEAAAAGRGGER